MSHPRTETGHLRASWWPVVGAASVWSIGAALTPWLGVWGGVGGPAVLLCVAFLAAYRKSLQPLLHVCPSRILWGGLAGLVMIAATYLLFPLALRIDPGLNDATRHLYRLFNSGPPELRFALLPVVIFGEEVVWRGIVQSAIARRTGEGVAAAITALIYASAHAPMREPLLALLAFACGLYWSGLRARTASLIPSLVSHLLWDVVVMVLIPLAR